MFSDSTITAMLRALLSVVTCALVMQTPALACRVAPANPPTIMFEQIPRDVRLDLFVLEVVFEDLDAFPSRRENIGRARIVQVLQGNVRARDVYLPLPSSAACEAEVRRGQRGYIIGRLRRIPGFLVVLEPSWVSRPETWRRRPE